MDVALQNTNGRIGVDRWASIPCSFEYHSQLPSPGVQVYPRGRAYRYCRAIVGPPKRCLDHRPARFAINFCHAKI